MGYLLLAAIIETAGGQAYGRFVTENVFSALGMASTTSGPVPEAARVASGHHGGRPVPLVAGLSGLPGTGDVWTTVGDLLRYADGVRDGGLLSERSWQLMGQSHMGIDDPSSDIEAVSTTAYGYGTYLGTIAGKPARFHHGDNPGFRSLLAWLPEAEVTFAVLSNDDSVPLDDIAVHIARTTDEGSPPCSS